MKKTILFALFLIAASTMKAQFYWEPIDHQGNRTQTYPKVTETNPEIQAMLNQVDTVNIFNSIAWMQQFIRDAYSPEALLTQNWLIERYEELGLEPSIHYFIDKHNDTLDAGNVIAIQPGTVYPDEYIIVSSHYDHPDGPGADDNASGTAGVLEAARILSQYSFKRSIIYVNFNAEENGLYGSMGYAKECAHQDMNILGDFNLDMIGWYPPELDTIKMYTACYHLSRNLYEYYISVANLYLPETPTLWLTGGEAGRGDHIRLCTYEYPAIYLGDVEYLSQHPCYHTPCDTIGNGVNNFKLAEAFVKATIAATAELANGDLPPQHFAATCDSTTIYLRWDEAENAIYYRLFRDDVLIAELTDTAFEDNEAYDSQMHDYYVVAVKTDGMENNESNHEKMMVSPALSLPFFNDFNEDARGVRLLGDGWQHLQKTEDDYYWGMKASFDKDTNGFISVAETDWFSIPSDISNVTLSFDYFTQATFDYNFWDRFFGRFNIQVSTDRVRWHLLDALHSKNWKHVEFSLNDYIGEPFVQVRILAEDVKNWHPENKVSSVYDLYGIDNLTIDFSSVDLPETKYELFTTLEICPNPTASQIEIHTDLDDSYLLSIYNLTGIKVMEINDFHNGSLDISTLPSGVYFIKATQFGKSISKRIIKQ
ncbi:MAG: M28 family peptidase [Bacteroidales bacterium]|nr:M28 family peptidase [Bacteroidales bacterium]